MMAGALPPFSVSWGEPVCPPSIPFLSLSSLPAGGEAGQDAAALRDRGGGAHGLALLWTPDFLHLPLPRLVLSPPYMGL